LICIGKTIFIRIPFTLTTLDVDILPARLDVSHQRFF
jgi:hypothetical protein